MKFRITQDQAKDLAREREIERLQGKLEEAKKIMDFCQSDLPVFGEGRASAIEHAIEQRWHMICNVTRKFLHSLEKEGKE